MTADYHHRVPPSRDVLQLWIRSVNCSAAEIEEWHSTPESASVGSRGPGDRWSVGQLAGMRTVELLEAGPEAWSPADEAHVRRVAGFVRRHRAQWPRGDVRDTRWRHSLRNWGHDPLWERRLALGPSTSGSTREVLVDGAAVGVLRVAETEGGGVVVEHLELDEPWRGRGQGAAVVHRLAVEHDGRVELEVPPTSTELRALLHRRHFDAPAPDSPVVHLTGW